MSNLLVQEFTYITNTVPSNLWSSDSIDMVRVNYVKPSMFRKHSWKGSVSYRSDSFSAEKEFEADSLNDLLSMIGTFIQQVK